MKKKSSEFWSYFSSVLFIFWSCYYWSNPKPLLREIYCYTWICKLLFVIELICNNLYWIIYSLYDFFPLPGSFQYVFLSSYHLCLQTFNNALLFLISGEWYLSVLEKINWITSFISSIHFLLFWGSFIIHIMYFLNYFSFLLFHRCNVSTYLFENINVRNY